MTFSSTAFQGVLDQLVADKDVGYLCCVSYAFKEDWESTSWFRAELRRLGRLWINETAQQGVELGQGSTLFNLNAFSFYARSVATRRTRIDFLQWLIEKLKVAEKSS